jgi:hypothetical protein
MPPIGEKFGGCGIKRIRAATRIKIATIPKRRFNFSLAIFYKVIFD